MKFKVFYNEQTKKLDINCLMDNFNDVILPENLDQHVSFPIPKDLLGECKQYLVQILDEEDISALQKICDDMEALVKLRRDTIYKFREKYNPLIVKRCEQFREDYAEWFI